MYKSKFAGLAWLILFLAPNTWANGVEVFLKDRLDGDLSQYCIDIRGGFENADPTRGMQAHTCLGYRGEFGVDQVLDSEAFASNQFSFPNFDVCMTLDTLEIGAEASLSGCDDSESQRIIFAENGNIRPGSAPGMCLTAGDETTFGRNGTSAHQIRTLTLQDCSQSLAARQEWTTRDQPQSE